MLALAVKNRPGLRWANRRSSEGILLLLLLGVCVSGCTKKFTFSEGELATNASRNLLVYVRDESLVLRRGDVEQLIPLKKLGCATQRSFFAPKIFSVFPDGSRVLLFSTRGNMGGFDLFGHAGQSVGTACLFDLVKETSIPLQKFLPPESALQGAQRGTQRAHVGATTGRLYTWNEDNARYPLQVLELASYKQVELPMPLERAKCTVVETPADLLVACALDPAKGEYGEALLVRYGLEGWPPSEISRSTMQFETDAWGTTVELSPDGRFLIYKGDKATPGLDRVSDTRMLGIREIATGRQVLLRTSPDLSAYVRWEFTPDGTGVLIGDEYPVTEATGGGKGRVWLYRLDGTHVATWDFPERPWKLVAPQAGQGFWFVTYGDARWVPWKQPD